MQIFSQFLHNLRLFRCVICGQSAWQFGVLHIPLGYHTGIAGDVKIMAGVTIGEGAVIGCGSVVTHDIPPRVLAAGNPCRVIRPITASDRVGFVK